MEIWRARLAAGDATAAWDAFIEAYRALILATIRNTISDRDAVMDVFAHVCGALSVDNLARLTAFDRRRAHTAKFSSWLVVVVRHQTIDWLRARDGRRRISTPDGLTDLGRSIFHMVFVQGCSHVEAYERTRAGSFPNLSFSDFLKALRLVHQAGSAHRSSWLPRPTRAPPPAVPVDESPLADQLLEHHELKEQLNKVMALLEPEERLAIQLYLLDELPAGEVARVLGWKDAKSVYNCVYRALATMRAQLERAGITSTAS